MSQNQHSSAATIASVLGARLKRARLNQDLAQSEVAKWSGLSRKAVINAEKGKATMETFVAIMIGLGLSDQLENFLPEQLVSPIQAFIVGKPERSRASGKKTAPNTATDW